MSVHAKVTEFSIDLPYEITRYEPLKALAKTFEYMPDLKMTRWTFSIVHMTDVVALLGTPIEFNVEDAGMQLLINHSPGLEHEIQMRRYKGKGEITVERLMKPQKGGPDIDVFKVTWQQQKKPRSNYVPAETVAAVWDVIRRYDLDHEVKSKQCWEDYLKHMRIVRFNRPSGTVDTAKFFGSRVEYMIWYSAIKTLQHYRLIRHLRGGAIVRIADEFKLCERFETNAGVPRIDFTIDDYET